MMDEGEESVDLMGGEEMKAEEDDDEDKMGSKDEEMKAEFSELLKQRENLLILLTFQTQTSKRLTNNLRLKKKRLVLMKLLRLNLKHDIITNLRLRLTQLLSQSLMPQTQFFLLRKNFHNSRNLLRTILSLRPQKSKMLRPTLSEDFSKAFLKCLGMKFTN